MKNILKIFIAAIFMLSLNACSVTSRYPGFVTDNPAGEKEGRASYRILMGAFILDGGNGSIQKAAEEGGISKISTVDYETKSGLFISKITTIVTGE